MNLIPDFKIDTIDNIQFRVTERELKQIDDLILKQNINLIKNINNNNNKNDKISMKHLFNVAK